MELFSSSYNYVYTFYVYKHGTRTRLKPAKYYTHNRDGTRAKSLQMNASRFFAADDAKNSVLISELAQPRNTAQHIYQWPKHNLRPSNWTYALVKIYKFGVPPANHLRIKLAEFVAHLQVARVLPRRTFTSVTLRLRQKDFMPVLMNENLGPVSKIV